MRNSKPLWLPEFQSFRGFATLEVIVFHSVVAGVAALALVSPPASGILALIAGSSFGGVPEFIFISGVVLFNRYRHDFSVARFYKRRVNAVLWPYIVFSTFYFAYPLVAARATHATLSSSYVDVAGGDYVKAYVLGLATGSTALHLWFVLLILQLYALYPLIVRAYNRIALRRGVTVAVLLALLGIQTAYSILFPQMHALFVSGIFYFVLGIVVRDHYGAIKQKITSVPLLPLLVIVALVSVGYADVYYHVYLVPGSSSMYVWLDYLKEPVYSMLLIAFYLKISVMWAEPRGVVTRSVAKVGEDSFGIYLVHFFFVTTFSALFIHFGLGYTSVIYYAALIIATLLTSYAAVHVIYRLPYSRIIVGRPRKQTSTQLSQQKPHVSYSSGDDCTTSTE
ncbi:MAG: acyltransferase [Halobacteriota archaeon]